MTIAHKWIAGAVVLALALLAGSWFLLVSPKRTEAADLQAQAESQQATNQSLQTELALLKQQKKDLPEQQAALAALRTQVPQTPALPSLVRLLDQAAEKSGVDFVTLAPTAAVAVMSAPGAVEATDGVLPPEQLAAVNSDIVVNGGYFEIVKFVNALENLERYVLVTNMTIVESDSSGEEAGAGEDAGDLTATLSSRVFLLPSAPETVEPAAEPATETQ